MIRKYILGVFATILALTVLSSAAVAAPNVVVTNNGLALMIGETTVKPGSSVIMQVVPKGEGPLTSDGRINGYVNETIVERNGAYKLLFSLEGMYVSGNEYDCHIDIAGKEYFLVPLTEGSLIEVATKDFDRDTKTITITGSLWDMDAYGINLTLKIDGYEKTVKSTDDGKFTIEFTLDEAGITTYGMKSFVIAYANDESSYCEDNIEIVTAEPVLKLIRDNSSDSAKLEEILTNATNLNTLGFDESVLYGDCELSELAGTTFFDKLSKTVIKADKVSDLEKSIKDTYALFEMERNPSDRNLRRCIQLFGLDSNSPITAIYDNFNVDTEPAYLFALWGGSSFTDIPSARAFYEDAVLRTKLNTAEAWSDLMLFANSNNTLLGVDEQTEATFWQKLITKAPFASISDFKTKYNEALNTNDTPSGGGGGSSGGGGGGGGGAKPNTTKPDSTKPEDKPNEKPEESETQKPQGTETNTVFSDISTDHWASEPITKLYEMGIISGKGEGEFAPNDLVTRAEVAKLMCASANIDKSEAIDGKFVDVDGSHWAIGYIEAAFESGLINGRGDGNYGPAECTTREDMAVFCFRLLKVLKPEFENEEYASEDLTFADSGEISDYAVSAVAAMSKLGIINGKGENKFDPKAYCTRAEAARIFYGVLQ